jgi:hypothetical protein
MYNSSHASEDGVPHREAIALAFAPFFNKLISQTTAVSKLPSYLQKIRVSERKSRQTLLNMYRWTKDSTLYKT